MEFDLREFSEEKFYEFIKLLLGSIYYSINIESKLVDHGNDSDEINTTFVKSISDIEEYLFEMEDTISNPDLINIVRDIMYNESMMDYVFITEKPILLFCHHRDFNDEEFGGGNYCDLPTLSKFKVSQTTICSLYELCKAAFIIKPRKFNKFNETFDNCKIITNDEVIIIKISFAYGT